MHTDWLYRMLKRLGKRAGVPNLHPHRFRHTFAIKWLEADQPERVLEIEGGWKRIPDTYFATLGEKHAAAAHQRMSPADRLGQGIRGYEGRGARQGKAKGEAVVVQDTEDNRVAHLGIIQDIIKRMASNSFFLKGWSVNFCGGTRSTSGQRWGRGIRILTPVSCISILGVGCVLYSTRETV